MKDIQTRPSAVKAKTRTQIPDLDKIPKVRDYDPGPIYSMLGLDEPDSDTPLMIAGPCAIESEEMLQNTASFLSDLGVQVLRGGSWKPRTLPYSFVGLEEKGLEIHHRVSQEHGMLSISEIFQRDQAEAFRDIGIIQIGTRSMRNYELLHGVAEMGKPVLLKRGMDATLEEWLGAAEHLLHHGADRLILCERGVRWHDPAFRNMLDFATVAFIKKHLRIPLVVDPSHGCGRVDLIESMCVCAKALGVDGLMIETHPSPKEALCDATQAISLSTFESIKASLDF
jgi:3-deoxy-7-phosphoheptulonate synthase